MSRSDWLDVFRYRELIWFAVREPLLMRCGPFLHIQARWKQRTAPDGQVWVVWVRSGAHGWGLCTAQLQHKWIFTWLCYTFSFLPNQVSKRLVALCDLQWGMLLQVTRSQRFSRFSNRTLRARMSDFLVVSLDCSVLLFSHLQFELIPENNQDPVKL